MSFRRVSLLRRPTYLLVVVTACRVANDAARTPLAAPAVAACYQFAYANGQPITSASGFWAAPGSWGRPCVFTPEERTLSV